jgi:hypothetical protein
MMSHTFDKYGVFYFSDIGEKECASYIGVIAVKKKEDHRVISYNEERKRFNDGYFLLFRSSKNIFRLTFDFNLYLL